MPNTDTIIGESSSGAPFTIPAETRARHLHIIGQTGTGKTSLLLNLLTQDFASGRGVCFLDPHGDAAAAAIALIPRSRAHHLIYLDLTNLDRPVGLNFLSDVSPDQRPTLANEIVAAFVHIFGENALGYRSQQVLRNSLRLLLDHQPSTLLAIPRLLKDKPFRDRYVRHSADPVVRFYWTQIYDTYDDRFRNEVISPLTNKLDVVLSTPAIRNLIGQPVSSFSFRTLIDTSHILIVNLAKGLIGQEPAHLLGALIASAIARAAFARHDAPAETRVPFSLYVDEFQNFATDAFPLILSEARKYALNLTVAHQYASQLSERLLHATLGNAATLLSFRLGAADAPLIAAHLGLPNSDALQDLSNFRLWLRTLRDGSPIEPALLRSLPEPWPLHRRAARFIRNSQVRFGRPRGQVERRIISFLAPSSPKRYSRRFSSRW